MGNAADELKELEELQNVGIYSVVENKIKSYVEKKYQVNVYKCKFTFNELNEIKMVHVYLSLTELVNKIYIVNGNSTRLERRPDDTSVICNIFEEAGLTFLCSGYGVLYLSFETVAMEGCYSKAWKEIRMRTKEYFNLETMDRIHKPMFVVYKTKNDMINAEKSGECKRIKENFYNLIKKYDKYNYITREKHLLVHFDSVETARNAREYSDLYWDMLR